MAYSIHFEYFRLYVEKWHWLSVLKANVRFSHAIILKTVSNILRAFYICFYILKMYMYSHCRWFKQCRVHTHKCYTPLLPSILLSCILFYNECYTFLHLLFYALECIHAYHAIYILGTCKHINIFKIQRIKYINCYVTCNLLPTPQICCYIFLYWSILFHLILLNCCIVFHGMNVPYFI